MQLKSTPQAKSPGKRKSIANPSPNNQNGSNKTPKQTKQGAVPRTPANANNNTPNKKKNPQTPKVIETPIKSTVTPQSKIEQNNTNSTGGKQKRKQSLATTEASSPKQPKLEVTPDSPSKEVENKEIKSEGRKKSNKGTRFLSIRRGFAILAAGLPLPQDIVEKVNLTISTLEGKELTKTAARKLHICKKLKNCMDGIEKPRPRPKAAAGEIKNEKKSPVQTKSNEKQQKNKNGVAEKKNGAKKESDSEDVDDEVLDEDDAEKDSESEDINNEEADEVNSEDDEEDSEDDEDDDEENDQKADKNSKVNGNQKQNGEKVLNKVNKSRYVLFAGNLPYGVDKDEIVEHFSKVGSVVDVRLPESKGPKPSSFAFVELADNEAYEVSYLAN